MSRFVLISAVSAAALFVGSSAMAADLIVNSPAPIVSNYGSSPSGNWDGFYLGVFGGYGAGTVNDTDNQDFFDNSSDSADIDGWFGGVTAGANFTLTDGIIAGVVGDIAWSGLTGWSSDVEYDLNWFGSLRGRVGMDAGAFMPYLTAGLAFANGEANDDDTFKSSNTHVGWTVGAGVEVAATDNMSIDVLYRYSDYGSKDYDLSTTGGLGLTSNTIQVGLNWKF